MPYIEPFSARARPLSGRQDTSEYNPYLRVKAALCTVCRLCSPACGLVDNFRNRFYCVFQLVDAQAQVSPADMPILRVGIECTLTQLLDKGFLHAVGCADTWCFCVAFGPMVMVSAALSLTVTKDGGQEKPHTCFSGELLLHARGVSSFQSPGSHPQRSFPTF